MLRRPPRSTRTDTRFPYTTLFRSITARAAGLDAFGVEIADFEVDFARQRLARVRPGDDPQDVFRLGDATKLDLPPASLDAVAFWNVLEHIESCDAMLEAARSEEHTSELQSLMRISYAVFCLNKKNN